MKFAFHARHIPELDVKAIARFKAKIDIREDRECWIWIAAGYWSGYGSFQYQRQSYPAHRIAYTIYVGPIPDGLTVDHLCFNKKCVNPKHLEAVTFNENIRRGIHRSHNAHKTHCINGHAFDDKNTYIEKGTGRRRCRKCNCEKKKRYYREGLPGTSPPKGFCKNGHALIGDNVRTDERTGNRQCRICSRIVAVVSMKNRYGRSI